MKLADRGLNTQAEALEEAQTEIRIAVRDGWLRGKPKAQINVAVQRIIAAALKNIKFAALRNAAVRSLNAFAERQYNTYLREFGVRPYALIALMTLASGKVGSKEFEHAAEIVQNSPLVGFNADEIEIDTRAHGIPLQRYAEDYAQSYVAPALDGIAAQTPLDPDDVGGRNSLRNRAEMEVRYNAHEESIAQLKASGVKLVVCSVHADCSDRCSRWQGRVYSLDGTSGTTADGKRYVPLEVARDVYYTTKAGKTYRNGLLGFNCRHELYPYQSGMIIPTVSAEERKREYAINTRQRELEKQVRKYRAQVVTNKGLDRAAYLKARRMAIAANKEYIRFSKDNGRAYYPSRTKLL